MKKMMLTIVLLSFFSFSMLPADSRMIPPRIEPTPPSEYRLSMMADSVDDMYFNCARSMKDRVYNEYMKNDLKNDMFKKVWEAPAIINCAKSGWWEQKDSKITKDHIRAICAYTSGKQHDDFYLDFNQKVREDKVKYLDKSFAFYTLHFFLTEAIQILKEEQNEKDKEPDLTAYRGSKAVFTGKKGEEMRFGQFASSSLDFSVSKEFGTKTCFVIQTRYGAKLEKYSHLKREQEVLIPPYEVFKIDSFKEDEKGCDNYFELKSVRYESNLNCKGYNLIKVMTPETQMV